MAELKSVSSLDPPQYSTPIPVLHQDYGKKKSSCSSQCMWALVFYAGAVTAAIITVSVLGAKYINDMEKTIKPPPTEDLYNEYELHHEDHADCQLDLKSDKQLFRFVGEEYGKNTMMILDFKKGVGGIHDGKRNVCFLIGGLDAQLANSTVFDQLLKGEIDYDEVMLYYQAIQDRPVKNLALLPSELYEVCWGKDVFWVEKVEDPGTSRHKRRAGCWGCLGFNFFGICIGWGFLC